MSDFIQSICDGLTNAISNYDSQIFGSNQDSYEILTDVFGTDFDENRLQSATEQNFVDLAKAIEEWFEFSGKINAEDARNFLQAALNQWRT